jgi:hypothetical protein
MGKKNAGMISSLKNPIITLFSRERKKKIKLKEKAYHSKINSTLFIITILVKSKFILGKVR